MNVSYKKIIAMVDEQLDLVELVEEHPCPSGSEWMIYQYSRTSPNIISAWRDGNKHHYVFKLGKGDLELVPSLSAAGIESISLKDEDVEITYAGLAGAGVGVGLRKEAENVISTQILEKGGGSKLGKGVLITPKMEKITVGIDDTDTKEEGATWVLANEVGQLIQQKGMGYYLDHTITQLFPGNPNKTQNCVSIALTFAIYPKYKYEIGKEIKKILKEKTLSNKTSIAIYFGITPSKSMRLYTLNAKREMVSIEDAKMVAMRNNIDIMEVTGDGGIIGAVAALGLSENHDMASKLPEDIVYKH
ncbi:methanogenesis imperfect marker protein 11 [Methanococcus voltae]|uniref:methanogenesis marker protein 11 n=1 Tax=Methanococcus voltae TaxID=2188 RepID=UPI001AE1940E|nr:methanogenesis marker protein 11 [Methanococcus voltae]MBP2143119.1 methanogenesis imperfect marker protein 11 [Methanococcus voltae]